MINHCPLKNMLISLTKIIQIFPKTKLKFVGAPNKLKWKKCEADSR